MDVLSLNPGELREQLEFYTAASTKDDSGGYSASNKTLAFTKLAKVMPKASKNSYEGKKTEFVETWEVLMRYETGRVPNESHKVKFKGEYFSIIGIENVMSRNLVLKITMVKK